MVFGLISGYDRAIVENSWNYCLSSNVKSGKSSIAEAHKHSLPLFTQALFIDYIIHFIIADDQVTTSIIHLEMVL